MKNTRALIVSVITVIWFVVIVTIASELYKPLKTLLALMTGHHWVTKSILAVVLLVLTYFLLKRRTTSSDKSDISGIYAVVGSGVAGGLIIFVFYVWHFIA